MSERIDITEDETKRLVVAITDFLRDQLSTRTDLLPEDINCLEIAIQSLEMAYGLEGNRYLQYRFSRPLLDIFNQVTNPVSVKDKIRADAHKEEGNNYMRRQMFENAETEYTHAIELDKWNSIYYCNRASSRIEQRNFFEAIADCRQALVLNPDYAKAHARMGQAYALMHRPREAARCYRQALEMEPENERYRNNLRVAENQIDRPNVAQVITNLLGSLFGLGPRTAQDRSSRTLPPSFMIITESHPPTQGISQITETDETDENSQIPQSTAITENGEQEDKSSLTTSNNGNISFPQPYGVIDEGEEEQPIFNFQLPTENEDRRNEEEFSLSIPLISFEFFPHTQPSTLQPESILQNAEQTDDSHTEKSKHSEEKSSLQTETEKKQHGSEKPDTLENQNASTTSDNLDENQTGKSTTQDPGHVKEKKTDSVMNDGKNDKTSNREHSSDIVFTEQQSKLGKCSQNGNNVSSATEKLQDNSKGALSQAETHHKDNNNGANEKQQIFSNFRSNKKYTLNNNKNAATAQNEETDGGETSEKHNSLEDEVD